METFFTSSKRLSCLIGKAFFLKVAVKSQTGKVKSLSGLVFNPSV
jgi:hypothetical protein